MRSLRTRITGSGRNCSPASGSTRASARSTCRPTSRSTAGGRSLNADLTRPSSGYDHQRSIALGYSRDLTVASGVSTRSTAIAWTRRWDRIMSGILKLKALL